MRFWLLNEVTTLGWLQQEMRAVGVEWHAEGECVVEGQGQRMGWGCLPPSGTGEDGLMHASHVDAHGVVARRGALVMITHGGRSKLTLTTVANKDGKKGAEIESR
jgi:hypothetical protein